MNEALRLYNVATGRFTKRFVVRTYPKRVIYSVPDLSEFKDASGYCRVTAVVRVNFNYGWPLDWTSVSDMDGSFPNWQIQTTVTSGCPTQPTIAGPMGLNYFFVWPADRIGGNALQVDAVITAPVLVNSGDYVNLDSTEIVGLLDFTECLLAFKVGGIMLMKTQPLLNAFLVLCRSRNDYLRSVGPFKGTRGEDASRRLRPRRETDRSGVPAGIGQR